MAKKGHRLERTFAPVEMFDHAQDIIMKSSSDNGLFPGQLDDFSKEPALFDRELFRDFYFHVGFEIPYILLRTLEEPEQQTSETPPKTPGQRRPRLETPQSPVPRARELSPMPEPVVGTVPGYINTQDGRAFAIQRTLKRQNPYGRLVDLSNIVEVPEEWIYRQQEFLRFIPPTDQPTLNLLQSEAPSEIKKAMENSLFRNAIDTTDTNLPTRENCYVSISDVRKDRKQRKWSVEEKTATESLSTYKELWSVLQEKRDATDSKKRLVYSKSPDYIVASLCYVASPELERGHIAQFFDRHAKVHANWLYDDTVAVLNSWITEVHFRFFQVLSPHDGEIPSQESMPIRQIKSQKCGISGDDACLVDAVISFRISGDFFDRYWTCYIAQHFSNPKDLESPLTKGVLEQTTHWQQRKVLELMLMNHILEKVYTSTKLILRRIEQGPRQKTSDAGEKYFSKDSFEDRKPGELRECFQLLVILKDNIASLQGLIEQWNTRESSQGRERPRWTRSDEQKYRKSIKQKTAQFEDHNREIKAAAARIEFLIALVTNAQDAIRAKKSLREAENITLFTCVTVFFLPVGLAVSVFGMNGIPDRTTIVSMLVTAAVALLITVCVLWFVLNHLISFGFRSPFSVFKSRTRGQRLVELDGGGPPEEHPNQRIRRRLSLAYNSPSKLRKHDRDLEGQTELTRKERLSTSDERSFK
jgi:Mg2+ and Co2+ transporter CorA